MTITSVRTPLIPAPILNSFELHPELASTLDRYYLLHWSGEYFQSLYSVSPRFNHQGIPYQILFHQGDVAGVLSATKVAVSFRYLGSPYSHGYALVRAVRPQKI